MSPSTTDGSTIDGATAAGAPHWPALDGLRGVAVAGVVVFHLRPSWLPGGFLGVDLFFALSGFLITSLLLRDAASSGGVSLRRFWGRRFRRLLPAVMVMIAAVLVWGAAWGTPAEQAAARGDAAWAVPYLANWHLIESARDYWASATADSPFTHLWSLAIEEQFYVVWPLVVWLLVRRASGRRALPLVTALGAVASCVALVALHDPDSATRAYMGTDTRAFALLFGAWFATDAVRSRVATIVRLHPRATGSLTVAVLAALGLVWWYGGEHLSWLLSGGLIAHSLLAAALVCVLSLAADGPLARVLSVPVATWVGRMSYGIYLWHWPVIQLGRPRLVDLPRALQDVLLLAISLVLAIASYHLIEHPIRRQRGWAHGRRAAWATVATAAVATVAIVVAPTGRGHVAAFDVASIASAPTTDAPGTTDTPRPRPAPAVTSVTTTVAAPEEEPAVADAPPTTVEAIAATAAASTSTAVTAPTTPAAPRAVVTRVLWIGDSIAADEAPAVIAALTAAGVTAVDGSFAARRLVSSDGVDAEELYPPLIAEVQPELVVVQLTSWDSPHPGETQRDAFTWFLELVRSTGAEVVFVTPPPVRADATDAGMAQQVALVEELAASDPGVHLLDSAALWGPELDTDVGDDGAPDRKPDGIHVCPQGAARFAAWLVDRLDELVDGLTPVFPSAWLAGTWTTDPHYDTPVGACAAVDPAAG